MHTRRFCLSLKRHFRDKVLYFVFLTIVLFEIHKGTYIECILLVRTTSHLQKKEEIGHSIGNSTERKGKDKIYVRVRFNICQTCRTSTFLLKIRNLCESKSFCVTILHENMILRRNGVFALILYKLRRLRKILIPQLQCPDFH